MHYLSGANLRFENMKLALLTLVRAAVLLPSVACTILQNGQVRVTRYPDTTISTSNGGAPWTTYPPNATELSYKGRWDEKFISCECL